VPSVNGDSRRGVLQAGTGGIKYDDLVGRFAAGLAPRNNFGQLGVDVGHRHVTRINRMVQLADASGLRCEVGHDLGVREQRGLDLLLGLVVRADGGDKPAGRIISRSMK